MTRDDAYECTHLIQSQIDAATAEGKHEAIKYLINAMVLIEHLGGIDGYGDFVDSDGEPVDFYGELIAKYGRVIYPRSRRNRN